MKRFTKATLVFLYCVYIVCSFLPTEFTLLGGQKIFGSEFLFAYLNGTDLVSTWRVSAVFLAGMGIGLFMTLFFSKKIWSVYTNLAVNTVFSLVYIISLITGIGKGIGIEVCLVISAIILIISVFSAVLFDKNAKKKEISKEESQQSAGKSARSENGKAQASKRNAAPQRRREETNKPKAEPKGNLSEGTKGNFMNAKLCPYCGKLLFANEVCSCKMNQKENHPVKTRKCEYCGRILFGNEKCVCGGKKQNNV